MIDTHAHLTDGRFGAEVPQVLERARAAGVSWLVSIGSSVPDSEAAIELAESHPEVYATAGIHPHEANTAGGGSLARVRELAANPRVVAIGETGLDYHYDNAPRPAQRESFRRHLELGAELDLPVVVHAREADDEVAALLREAGRATRGVLHCFTGGRALLETALELGWHVSFTGIITFPAYADAELLRLVPLERLLLETDSPYLTPVPHRGKRNEPAYLPLVARRAAALRGEAFEALVSATTANAHAFYGVER